jgi:hypothetical protein
MRHSLLLLLGLLRFLSTMERRMLPKIISAREPFLLRGVSRAVRLLLMLVSILPVTLRFILMLLVLLEVDVERTYFLWMRRGTSFLLPLMAIGVGVATKVGWLECEMVHTGTHSAISQRCAGEGWATESEVAQSGRPSADDMSCILRYRSVVLEQVRAVMIRRYAADRSLFSILQLLSQDLHFRRMKVKVVDGLLVFVCLILP